MMQGAAPNKDGDVVEVDLGEDDPVEQDKAFFGDPIIGHDVVYDPEKGPGALLADILPAPKGMTPAAWARHCVTHLPYDPTCPYCVACRRPSSHHRATHEADRTVPQLVGDY